jgi:hypothetical protein
MIIFSRELNIKMSYSFLQIPKQLQIKYKNPITIFAKEKLLKANFESNIINMIASAEDNTDELLTFLKNQDELRGTKYENCYNWT